MIKLGCGRLFRFIYRTPVVFGWEMSWNDDRLIEICLKSALMAPARSWVEMTVRAVEILRQ